MVLRGLQGQIAGICVVHACIPVAAAQAAVVPLWKIFRHQITETMLLLLDSVLHSLGSSQFAMCSFSVV